MKSKLLDDLLEKLQHGDAEAETAFRAYEPYLRMVVRRRLSPALRRKFDSVDVVQSVWAGLLAEFRGADWQFRDADQLRAFLVTVTRNRFLDHARQQGKLAAREEPLGPAHDPSEDAPRPSQEAQAGELWERMLALCPPAHRELLDWKRQGYSLDEIAARSGLHKSSVRRILYDLARRVSETEQAPADREHE